MVTVLAEDEEGIAVPSKSIQLLHFSNLAIMIIEADDKSISQPSRGKIEIALLFTELARLSLRKADNLFSGRRHSHSSQSGEKTILGTEGITTTTTELVLLDLNRSVRVYFLGNF